MSQISLSDKREEIVAMMKLAEQCERYADMVKYAKKLAELPIEPTPQELVLYTSAYKNATVSRRTAWRAITTF